MVNVAGMAPLSSYSDSDEFSEFGDDELLRVALSHEAELLKKPTAYQEIMKNGASTDWNKAEMK